MLKIIFNLLQKTRFWNDNYLFLREFKYFPKVLLLAIIFTLLAVIFEGIGVGFLIPFVQNITYPNSTPIHTGIEWIDSWILGVNASNIERLYRISILILISNWLRAIFNYLSQVYSGISQFLLSDRIRQRLFEQFQKLDLSYFKKTHCGELVNSITNEVYQLMYAGSAIANSLVRASTLFVYIAAIILLSWQLSAICIILFSLVAFGMKILLGRLREASLARTMAAGNFTSFIMEFISGIKSIQAAVAHKVEQEKFNQVNLKIRESTIKAIRYNAVIEPISEVIAITIIVVILIISVTIFVPNNQIQPAALLTFLFILLRLTPIVRYLNAIRAQIRNYQGSLENLKNLLKTDDKPYFKNGNIPYVGLKENIQFISVDFGYELNDLVLRNVNLTINRGKMTALVGASGAGKTTLVDLIPRFYDPIQGQILIDDIDLRKFEINSLRHQLAVVSQDTFIFNTTVWNNIAYGIKEVNKEAVWEAARLANALEFILKLPYDFNTELGDRGVRLSGGQRQRIAIARALLRDPEILILDEATSALDSLSERLIQESLEKLSLGRTVIAIAHRLSTIARADQVIVLESGCVVEQGNYQDLLAKRGKLWEYHQMQYSASHLGAIHSSEEKGLGARPGFLTSDK